MGWFINETSGEISHAGDNPGCTSLVVRRKDGVAYVMFCNTFDLGLSDSLKGTLDAGIAAVRLWPSNDLFPATISYEAWQARHFTPAELDQPAVSGDDADPDADGISNLIEYAQGSDPRTADHEPWLRGRPVVVGDQLRLAVEYRRRPLGHAVEYNAEVSDDLKLWAPFPATLAEQLGEDGRLNTTLVDTDVGASTTARFVRVKVRRANARP